MQRQKPEVRDRLLNAARAELAERGYPAMRLTSVAKRAGSSIGNLYKYVAHKEALLAAAVPESLVEEIRQLLARRVAALGSSRDAFGLPPSHAYVMASKELLDFTLGHREVVCFLLTRAQGSPWEHFNTEICEDLAGWAVDYAKRVYPDYTHSPLRQRALLRIYRHYLEALAEALLSESSAGRMREAIELQARYHLSGLAAVFASRS